jgi:putative DNA primase/helicase
MENNYCPETDSEFSDLSEYDEFPYHVNEPMRDDLSSEVSNEVGRDDPEFNCVNAPMRNSAGENPVNGGRRNQAPSTEYEKAVDCVNGKSLSDAEIVRLNKFNQTFCHVVLEGKHKVVSTKPCPIEGRKLHYEALHEFRNNFLHEPKIAGKNAGEAWCAWNGKNYKPDGIGFYPRPSKCPATVMNLFSGFPMKAMQGDVSPILYHITEVLCDGDKKAADFVIGWLAHLFQKPDEKPSVAILLKSIEGTGKGTLYSVLQKIIGHMALQVNGGYQLTGRFNSVVANRLLIFADEVDLTDVRSADKLKGLISEPRVSMEKKGLDPIQLPNYGRFIFASNHDHVIKAGPRERRFLVLESSAKYAQDSEYFSQLYKWIENNGPANLLGYLLAYDLSDFDPRKAPVTAALITEKLANLTPYQEFMFLELIKPLPFGGIPQLETRILVEQCQRWLSDNGYDSSIHKVGSSIGKLVSRMQIKRIGKSGRGDYYEMPESNELRDRFCQMIGHTQEQIFG